MEKKDKHEEEARLKRDKEREQKNGFEKWCQRQAELEERKRDAQRQQREAEAELEVLEEYRKRDAEEEYENWKQEKSRGSTPPKLPEHPLGWAPAGKSDGRHRICPNVRPATPGEPLSKTLTQMKGGAAFKRRLKTVDVCCRQISFWCHCQSDDPSPPVDDTFRRSFSQPARCSTPIERYSGYSEEDGESIQFSKHTTPVSSRPSSARSRR